MDLVRWLNVILHVGAGELGNADGVRHGGDRETKESSSELPCGLFKERPFLKKLDMIEPIKILEHMVQEISNGGLGERTSEVVQRTRCSMTRLAFLQQRNAAI